MALNTVAAEGTQGKIQTKDGVYFMTDDEVLFAFQHMRDRNVYDNWVATHLKEKNKSTSNYYWNLELFPHSNASHKDCWYAIFCFAEHTCKAILRPLQKKIAQAPEFDKAYSMWMEGQKSYAKNIRETGLKDGIPVNADDWQWQEKNLRLDKHELQCQIVRALHHIDGALLRPAISAYMLQDSNRAGALQACIQRHLAKTSGVNVRDKVYLHIVFQFPTIFKALSAGLDAMREQVWALEWCADWAPQILFWLYPRGPGYRMIDTAIKNGSIAEVLSTENGLYKSLLKLRGNEKALGWQSMIQDAWKQFPDPPLNSQTNVYHSILSPETQRQLDQAILRIVAEYLIRERPWQLPQPHEKQLDSVQLYSQ